MTKTDKTCRVNIEYPEFEKDDWLGKYSRLTFKVSELLLSFL